ncbi:MAG: CYTH domain-containing protein [Bacteroidota bacterium]
MSKEIERKFLVTGEFKNKAVQSSRIIQGYLNSDPERAVRVRIRDSEGYLTIKGMSNESGTSRYEWEKQIDVEEARKLLEICEPGVIDKTRYIVPWVNHTFEVDEFYGENAGLILAEVELKDEHEDFEKPDWVGKEVTGDKRFYNVMLKKHPYAEWEEKE